MMAALGTLIVMLAWAGLAVLAAVGLVALGRYLDDLEEADR